VTSNPPLPRTQGWGNHGFRLYQKGGPAPHVERVKSPDPDSPHFPTTLGTVKHGLPHFPSENLGKRLPLVVAVISTAAGATNHGGLSIGCCSTTVPVRRNHVGRDTVDDEPGGVRRK
jgi:hypothetical protein